MHVGGLGGVLTATPARFEAMPDALGLNNKARGNIAK